MSAKTTPDVSHIDGITVFGVADNRTLDQARRCAETAERTALMADNHLGYAQPVGGVTAYRGAVSLSGVGYDIGCGNKAVCLDLSLSVVRARIGEIMDEVVHRVSFGVGRRNPEPVESVVLDDPLFDEPFMREIPAGKGYTTVKDVAAAQLGTVGSGNHYVDIFESERGAIWVGVHFGSRGLGHKITTHFLRAAGANDGIDAEPCVLPTDSDLGEQYMRAMQLAGRYAYAGRDWVCSEVARILGGEIVREVHNHHNFAWAEEHDGEELVVVRKGATPAFPGQEGFVGGSMGDISVILEGVESEWSRDSLYSTVHGAGRVMSRTEAAGKKRWKRVEEGKPKQLVQIREGKISRGMMMAWIDRQGVELRGGGTDESPHCYKRIEDVLAAHAGTVKVTEILHPVGVAMAGAGEFDPYKD